MSYSMSIDGLVNNQTISIEIQNFSFGSRASTSAPLGPGAGAGRAQSNKITVTKSTDKYSPALYQASAQGHQVQVSISANGTTYILSDAFISSVQTSGKGESPLETITFDYAGFSTKIATPPPGDPSSDDNSSVYDPDNLCYGSDDDTGY